MFKFWMAFCFLFLITSPSWAGGCSSDQIEGAWRDADLGGLWTFKSDGAVECVGDCRSSKHYGLAGRAGGQAIAWETTNDANLLIYFSDGDERTDSCKFLLQGRILKVGSGTWGYVFNRLD